jgi:thiamine-phosphate pyrophosphorylase
MLPVDFCLYLVTDRHQTAGRPLLDVIEQALAAGVRAIQLREPDLHTRPLLALAKELRVLTTNFGARLLINDRIDLAMAVEADGVHLRASSMPVSAARRLLGSHRLIGVSTHSLSDVVKAEGEGADFVVLGPVYDTPSKRSYGEPIGLSAVEKATARCRVPVFAIGGVSGDRMAELRHAGASGVAVISAILSAVSARDAVATLLNAWR